MRLSNRLLVGMIFTVGVAAGIALAVFFLLLPRRSPTEAFAEPTSVATPTVLPDSAFVVVAAQDEVLANLYDRVGPSVVHIASRKNVVSMFYGVVPQEGTGSGFVYDDQGHVVTNNHVVEGASELDVLFSNGLTLPAQLVGTDPYYDLAVVKVDIAPDQVAPLQLGDSSTLRVGQMVVAIGNPFGLDRTLTTGVISALGRRIETDAGTAIGQAIQTDAAINPGNSGGPLLDIRGRVVGINTAINSPSGGSVGIGFAVPANIVEKVIPSLISDGKYAHPSLGVQVAELGTEVVPPQGGTQRGLLIVQVQAGGPAAQAQLQAATVRVQRGRYVFSGGDILVAIGGSQVATRNDMLLALEEKYRPGDAVDVTIVRDGQSLAVKVVLTTQ